MRSSPLPGMPDPLARPAEAATADDGSPPRPIDHYRAIFISDLHLGTAGCKAAQLLDFLQTHESDSLYLVGDIIDTWQLRRKWFWNALHDRVIQELLRKAADGTRVVFVPGNHDEPARQFDGLELGGVQVRRETVHTLLDGRRLWVTHGDFFDGVIQHARWLAVIGDQLYTFILWLNDHFNRLRHRLGLHYWSLSQYLKHRVKDAVGFICDFEQTVAREARRRGFDGVVCGHIHQARIRMIDGMLYCNDGDWVESLTALVETYAGRLEVLQWRPGMTVRPDGELPAIGRRAAAAAQAGRPAASTAGPAWAGGPNPPCGFFGGCALRALRALTPDEIVRTLVDAGRRRVPVRRTAGDGTRAGRAAGRH